jgi:ribosomal protein S18 acetylase RimI-like enzyme
MPDPSLEAAAFREATPEDLPAICALGEAVNLLHHEAWPDVFAGPGDPMRHADHWRQGIGQEKATTFVCEADSKIVGFASVAIVQDTHSLFQHSPFGRVGSVSVEPEHQGKGVGRTLMLCAERWARERGVTDIRLHVWEFNQRALSLYAELGYEIRSHVLGKRLGEPDA